MKTIVCPGPLFPVRQIIDWLSNSEQPCPECGETQLTDCITGHTTALCGYSRFYNPLDPLSIPSPREEYPKDAMIITVCCGDRYHGFIELPVDSDEGK